MSIRFDEVIHEHGDTVVKINFSGLDIESKLKESNSFLHIYAYSKSTGESVFNCSLGIETIRNFYHYLGQFSVVKDSESTTETKFIEADNSLQELIKQVKSVDSDLLQLIFEKMESSDKIKSIITTFSNEELENLEAARKQTHYKKELDILEELLKIENQDPTIFCNSVKNSDLCKIYHAGQPEKIFQNWIEKNLWAIDGSYIKKHDKTKISISSDSDLLLETTDGFIDLIELKRSKEMMFKYDSSHKCYYPSASLAKVIGQSLHYLSELDVYKNILENDYKVKVVKPRILVFIGRSNSFKKAEFKTLRMLNSNLNHIQIFSYDYILSNGNNVLKSFDLDN